MTWREIFAYFNLLPCPRCGKGYGDGAGLLCHECLLALPLIPPGEHCPGCGMPPDGPLAMCRACIESGERPWQDAASVMEYRGEGAKFIRRFKSGSAPELARPLGFLGAELVREFGWKADLIVPIPLRLGRLWKRSYNQSALFGLRLGAELGIPMRELLVKLPGSRKQAGLTRAGRLRNRIRFKVRRPEELTGRDVIVVDDIFTTGSTLVAAVKALRRADAGRIYVVTCARTPLRS